MDEYLDKTKITEYSSAMSDMGKKWVRMAPNGTNLGLLIIRFHYKFWRTKQECTEI